MVLVGHLTWQEALTRRRARMHSLHNLHRLSFRKRLSESYVRKADVARLQAANQSQVSCAWSSEWDVPARRDGPGLQMLNVQVGTRRMSFKRRPATDPAARAT